MAVSITPNTPSLSMSINLQPSIYDFHDLNVPNLTVTATLDGTSHPITLCVWRTILNIHQALGERRFDIIDQSTGRPVAQTAKKTKRPPITRQFGTSDQRLFITLEPGVPHTSHSRFGPPADKMDVPYFSLSGASVFGVRGLKKGKYLLRVSRDERSKHQFGWWRNGTKEDNLVPANEHGVDTSLGHSAAPSPIVIDPVAIPPVSFEVVDSSIAVVNELFPPRHMSFANGENTTAVPP